MKLKDGTEVELVAAASVGERRRYWVPSDFADTDLKQAWAPQSSAHLHEFPRPESPSLKDYMALVVKEPPLPAKPPGLTQDKAARKQMPVARGVLDYFPLAIAEIARVSHKANEQHNPGEPMHWARHKSTDHADCIARHLIERGTVDNDGLRHAAKLAWRALALLQTELELEQGYDAEAVSRAKAGE